MITEPEIGKEYILEAVDGNLKANVKLVRVSGGSYLFRNIKGAEELERRNYLSVSFLAEDELDCFYLEAAWFPNKFTLEEWPWS